jgi:tetratricopeptide (TPR) repeat protein
MMGSEQWHEAQDEPLTINPFVQTVAMRSPIRKSSFGPTLFVSILLFAVAVFAAPNNTLIITGVDESGKALAGCRVQILALGTGGTKWQEKKADNSGVARFEKLDDGAYRVVARPDGLAPALDEPVILKNGAQQSITIKCSPGDPLKKFYWEDPTLSQQAQQDMSLGITSLQAGKLDDAEKQFRASVEISPANPPTLFYLGYTLIQEKKLDDALDILKKVSDELSVLAPLTTTKDAKGVEQPSSNLLLKQQVNYVLGVTLIQEKKWDDARGILQKLSDELNVLVPLTTTKDDKGVEQPSSFLPLKQRVDSMLLPAFKLGVEANDELAKQNYKGAIAKYQEALKISENDPDTYYNLALALAHDNQYEAADQAIDKALALKADDQGYQTLKKQIAPTVTLGQADRLYNSKDFAAAVKKYEEALPLLTDPRSQAKVYDVIGKAHSQLNQSDQAVQAYRRAAELDPQNAQYKADLVAHYRVLGQQYLNEKQYDQAWAAYAEAGLSAFQLGQEWSKKDETSDLAVMAFQKALKDDPQNAEVYYELGMVYWLAKHDTKLATENLSKYVPIGKDPAHVDNAKSTLAVIARKK